jgi:hypothetical protein
MRVEVDGVDTPLRVNSLSADNAIGQRSTGSLLLRDDAGAFHYEMGQRVDVIDDAQGNLLVFSGVIDDDDEDAIDQSTFIGLAHKVAMLDWHYLADKRLVAKSYVAGQLAGDVFSDVVLNFLAEEGVVGVRVAPAFSRATVAYYANGSTDPYVSQALSGVARYEAGGLAASKAIRVEEATTNLLSANQSDVETNTTGFSAAASTILSAGATITRDTAHKYAGSAALKIVTTNALSGEGAEAQLTSLLANTKYAISVWLDGTASQVWQLIARDFTNAVQVTQNVTLGADWTRVTLIITTGASAVTDFRVGIKTTAAVAQTVWADGWQVEAKAHPTTWQVGGTARNKDVLTLPALGAIRPQEGTVQFRAYIDATVRRQESPNNGGNLLGIDIGPVAGAGGALNLFHSNNSGNWVVNVNSTQFPSFSDSFTPDGWHAFALAWDKVSVLVYVDGVLRATQNTPTLAASFAPLLYIGANGLGADQANTLFQDVRLSSRKRTATELAADAALSTFLTLDQWTTYLAPLNNSLSYQTHIANGATLPDVVFDYGYASDCFDALAKKSQAHWWQIDQYKQAWFQPYAAVAAPWSLTADGNGLVVDARRGSVKVKRAKPKYRNKQYVRDVTGQTSTQIETRKGDGTATAFTLNYPIAKVPTVEVQTGAGSFIAKTVGIKGLDTGKDWYWNGGDATVGQDTAGVKLTSSDTLRVTYVGQFPLVIISEDSAQIAAQQTLEGGGTSGKVESVTSDASLTTSDAAFTEASALLAKYAQKCTSLKFTTSRAGLAPGQLIHVTIPRHGLDDDLLIESVHISDQDGVLIWYDVSALKGPINDSWVQFFGDLIKDAQAGTATLQVGASSTLVTSSTFAASASPSASYTATVYACPLFPAVFPLTLC